MGYLPVYKKYIENKNKILPKEILRNNFYLLKEYTYVDGTKESFNSNTSPIIFTLFVSKSKDIVHCVKVSDISPTLAKRFFSKFLNENTGEIEMKGRSSAIYSAKVNKFPKITSENYRTYKLSGIGNIFLLDVNTEQITPKIKKSAIKQKVSPKPKIEAKSKIEPKPKITPIKRKK